MFIHTLMLWCKTLNPQWAVSIMISTTTGCYVEFAVNVGLSPMGLYITATRYIWWCFSDYVLTTLKWIDSLGFLSCWKIWKFWKKVWGCGKWHVFGYFLILGFYSKCSKCIKYPNNTHRFHSNFIKMFGGYTRLRISSSTIHVHSNKILLPIIGLPSNEKYYCFILANFTLLLNIIISKNESKFFIFFWSNPIIKYEIKMKSMIRLFIYKKSY